MLTPSSDHDVAQQRRRERWFALTREHLHTVVNADGSGRIPQFNPPYREPAWILPALYSGPRESAELANRMVARYHCPAPGELGAPGQKFNIFQSNVFAELLNRFDALLTPAAREVMRWHTDQVFKTFEGSAQCDYKFHGANDNFPMMATKGLILGGEATGNAQAIRHGNWNLHQFRRLLSRSAWASEFNSSTYSPLTLSCVAKIGAFSRNAETRQLARDIEHRLWAEVILHWHPGTLHQAGPQCRAYMIDYAGHNHTLQVIMWVVFGAEVIGRDVCQTYFAPDGVEVLHFEGQPMQSIAEMCDIIDVGFQVPDELRKLMTHRVYPAIHRGRSECISYFEGMGGEYHTETYMERDFSMGSVNTPLCGGEQTSSVYVTYRRSADMSTFRNAGVAFPKYLLNNIDYGVMDASADGASRGERYIKNQGWLYALQKHDTAVLLSIPNLKDAPQDITAMRLSWIFPAHFGAIRRSIIGLGACQAGAAGESGEVVPVSIDTGGAYIHIQPLLPTNLPRRQALRFQRNRAYEMLDLINYEGPTRTFTRKELAQALNGALITVRSSEKYASLQAFHQQLSAVAITDYFSHQHRFILIQRADVEFEVVLSTDPFGIQTEAIDGHCAPRPTFESNQLDIVKLPFTSGPVPRNAPCFPWPELEMHPFDNRWIIGSRGLPGEPNYTNRKQRLGVV